MCVRAHTRTHSFFFPQSLSALGPCAFIQGSDDLIRSLSHTHTQTPPRFLWMQETEAVIRHQLNPVVAAAVQSWSLVLSITPASHVPCLHTRYHLPSLSQWFTHCPHTLTHSQLLVLTDLLGSVDAVGKAVARLFELAEEKEGEEHVSSHIHHQSLYVRSLIALGFFVFSHDVYNTHSQEERWVWFDCCVCVCVPFTPSQDSATFLCVVSWPIGTYTR